MGGWLLQSFEQRVGGIDVHFIDTVDDDDAPAAAAVTQTQSDDEQAQAQAEAQTEAQAEQAEEQADTNTNKTRPAREEEEEAEEQAAVSRFDKTPVDGGTIVQQSANVYETVDASLTVASPVIQVLARIQSKLLRFSNPDSGELTGDLASGWETPDGQTVVLQLRDGVTWHAEGPGADNPASTAGRALTAEDLA